MSFFSSVRQRKELIAAYNDLLLMRKSVVGRTVEDPSMSDIAVETEEDMKILDERYAVLETTRFRSFLHIFDRGFERAVRGLISDIREVYNEYTRKTIKRDQFGLLAPLAFSPEKDLAKHLGVPEDTFVFSLTWNPKFRQLSETTGVGLLGVIGVTDSGLTQWWQEGHPEAYKQDPHVWTDIRTLAQRLLCLFEKTVPNCMFHSESSVAVIGAEAQGKINGICNQFQRLAIRLAGLVYIRYEYLNDLRPLFELLIPVLCSFSVFLNNADWTRIVHQAIPFFEQYLTTMEVDLQSLVKHLDASDELNCFEGTDNGQRPAFALDNSDYILRQGVINELRKMGLIEVKLNIEKGGMQIGSGSFSNILRYPARDSTDLYAVKFFKNKKADMERTKRRLLREANRWINLQHNNINALLGFCVHPEEKLPGLVSRLCPYTLDNYLDENGTLLGKEKLRHLLEVAEALEYSNMHKRNVAHGDLRPANVLLSAETVGTRLTAKLCDFGVSHTLDPSDHYEVTTMQHTNMNYLAPELIPPKATIGSNFKFWKNKEIPKVCQVSLEGDVYAFGCCFLQVIYGKHPSPKKNGGLPARQDNIQTQHWEFLRHTWDSNPDKRPLATELVNHVLVFLGNEHSMHGS